IRDFHVTGVQTCALPISVKESEKKKSWISLGRSQSGERTLAIDLPDQLYDKIAVTNNVGDVRIEGLQAEMMDIQLDVGNLYLSDVSGSLALNMSTGTIDVEGFRSEQDV